MNLRKDHSQSLKSKIFLIVNLILFRMHIPDSEVNLGVRFVVTADLLHTRFVFLDGFRWKDYLSIMDFIICTFLESS